MAEGDFYVSSEASNGYVVGNNAWTGTTKDNVPAGTGPKADLSGLNGLGAGSVVFNGLIDRGLTTCNPGGAQVWVPEVFGASGINIVSGSRAVQNTNGELITIQVEDNKQRLFTFLLSMNAFSLLVANYPY